MNKHNVVLGYTFLSPTIMVTHELNKISADRWLIFKNQGHIVTPS